MQHVIKATLSTKKVVLLRPMKIRDSEEAAIEVAPRAGGDATVLQVLMTKALLNRLIVQIDGKAPTASERADMDELFSYAEYNQLLSVIKQLTGGDDAGGKPQVDLVPSGNE